MGKVREQQKGVILMRLISLNKFLSASETRDATLQSPPNPSFDSKSPHETLRHICPIYEKV